MPGRGGQSYLPITPPVSRHAQSWQRAPRFVGRAGEPSDNPRSECCDWALCSGMIQSIGRGWLGGRAVSGYAGRGWVVEPPTYRARRQAHQRRWWDAAHFFGLGGRSSNGRGFSNCGERRGWGVVCCCLAPAVAKGRRFGVPGAFSVGCRLSLPGVRGMSGVLPKSGGRVVWGFNSKALAGG